VSTNGDKAHHSSHHLRHKEREGIRGRKDIQKGHSMRGKKVQSRLSFQSRDKKPLGTFSKVEFVPSGGEGGDGR